MGKKQHQKDKLYLTTTEWRTEWGGHKGAKNAESRHFRRLPLDHCALSLQPFSEPYCDAQGNVFELVHIVPFLKRFKLNPVTGEAMGPDQLIKLNVHRNSDGKLHCPVLYKVFNDTSHVVAIKTTGNVFSHEAVEELNVKPRNWRDLLSDAPFARSDIIVLQEPNKHDKCNINAFHHIKNNLRIKDLELDKAKTDARARLRNINPETKAALAELDAKAAKASKPSTSKEAPAKADVVNAAPFSQGRVAASFTSTAMTRVTNQEAGILEDDVVRYRRVKKKGYVRIMTNQGPLNLELQCQHAPKTCENFIKLCQRGYYNGTKFHRSIRHFMIQGGDPTGTGKGGESCWGPDGFKDEFQQFLSHTGRGVLSMANSGPNTNKSQFFITYRSCKHLDKKHTVFGQLVGGMETLNAMERIETDNKDVPIEDIIIQSAHVFVDPFTEVDDQLIKERAEALASAETADAEKPKEDKEGKERKRVFGKGVGKFIDPSIIKEARKAEGETEEGGGSKKKKKSAASLSDFSSW